MHILSGDFKNRSIETPKKAVTRPTSSKMRAQLFNICQHKIEGAYFLDLFAGSGAMGLEALSRGANFSCFIDHDSDAMRTIKKNISFFNVEQRARCVYSDAFLGLKKIAHEISQNIIPQFDILFIDPPYFQKDKPEGFSLVRELLEFLDNRSQPVLKNDGWLFIEESRFCPIESICFDQLHLVSKRVTGDSCLYEFHYVS